MAKSQKRTKKKSPSAQKRAGEIDITPAEQAHEWLMAAVDKIPDQPKPPKKPKAKKEFDYDPEAPSACGPEPKKKRSYRKMAPKPPPLNPLTEQQQRFGDEYLVDHKGAQAAIRAGYSPATAHVQASRLLKHPSVAAYIAEGEKATVDGKPFAMPKVGRPSTYNDEIADEICARLMEGETMASICSDPTMPMRRTVTLWIVKSQAFAERHQRAREMQARNWADEIIQIADDGSLDTRLDGDGMIVGVDHEHISRSKLRIETRRFLMSKIVPSMFGDKVNIEHTGKDGGAIETKDMTDREIAQRAAFLLRRAMEAAGQGVIVQQKIADRAAA